MRSLVPRPPLSVLQSWERGGWLTRTRARSPHIPGLHRIQVVDRIKMVDNTNVIKSLKCRGVKCFGLYQVERHFFLDCHVIAVYSNCLTRADFKFFHWTDRQTDRLTDGQNRFLNPFAHARANDSTILHTNYRICYMCFGLSTANK